MKPRPAKTASSKASSRAAAPRGSASKSATPARRKRAAGDPEEAFRELLEHVRAEVQRRLAALWEVKLREVARHGAEVLSMATAARDMTLRGGKRFRAALLYAVYAGVSPRAAREVALAGGVALELLQSYLLTQDDWMDGDDMRRGGPSVHAALTATLGDPHLGAASAMLSSDLLWGLALSTLIEAPASLARRMTALELMCRAHEDVVIGQQLDMMGRAEDVEAMHALKTGSYTVRGPLLLGAALAGAGAKVARALERYAAPVGVAFQLRDDLLGTFGSSAQTGKPEGGDLRAGKRTALIAEAEDRLDVAGRLALERALGHAEASDEDVRAAAAALEACGARGAVEARLRALCDEAEAKASRLPLDPKARLVLQGAARALRMDRPGAGGGLPGADAGEGASASIATPAAKARAAPRGGSRSLTPEAQEPRTSTIRRSPAEGRAFGKIILLGEHTVVYGAPALAAGIDRGARASAARAPRGASSALTLGGRTVLADSASADDLARAFAALLAEGAPAPPVLVEAASDLPPGGGLGSSAAIAIAIARAIDALTGRSPTPSDILTSAAAWEHVFHGNPSGIDTAAAFHGGFLLYTRAAGAAPLRPSPDLWLCVGWSGESASTRAMVEGVARMRARKPELVDRSIAGAAALVENAKLALEAGDLGALGQLMNLNQMILAGLMVSTEAIERMCALAREAGALGAKLTGGGGGGSVIALVPPLPNRRGPSEVAGAVLEAWRAAGFDGFVTRAGAVTAPDASGPAGGAPEATS